MKKTLIYIFIFVVVMSTAIAVAFRYEPIQQRVIAYVIEKIESNSGMVVDVTNPVVSFPLRFRAEKIHLHQPNQKGIEVDSFELRLSLLGLLQSKLSFSKIFAEKVVLPESKEENQLLSWELFPYYLKVKNLDIKQLVLNPSLTKLLQLNDSSITVQGSFLINPYAKKLSLDVGCNKYNSPLEPSHFTLLLTEKTDRLNAFVSFAETNNGEILNSIKLPSGYDYKLFLQLSGEKYAWQQLLNNEKSANDLQGTLQISYFNNDANLINPVLGPSSVLKGKFLLSTDRKLDASSIAGSFRELPVKGEVHLTSDQKFENSLLHFQSDTMDFSKEFQATAQNVVGTIAIEGSVWFPTFKVDIQSPEISIQNSKIENASVLSNFSFSSHAIQGNISTQFQHRKMHLSGNALFEWSNNTLFLKNFSGTNGFGQGLGEFALSFADDTLNISSKGRIETLLEQFPYTSVLPVTGDTKIDLQLSGGVDKPQISGSISIENGAMEMLQIGSSIKQLKLHATVQNSTIMIDEISGIDSHGGSLRGTGNFELEVDKGMPLTLNLKLEKFTTTPFYYTTAMATGDLHFIGNLNGGSLSGKLVTDQVDITFPDEADQHPYAYPVTYINHPENARLPTTVKTKSFVWPLTFNLDVNVPSKGFINGQQWNSEWEGDFKIAGTLDAIVLQGGCTIKKGEYRFNGNAFQIDEGTITFAGDPYNKTTLYVIASRDLDEIKAEIILKGSLKNPAISFRSNPPLPQREILSWILFNKGSSEITPFQGTQLNESITHLDYSGGKPDMLTRIRNRIGIDKIDISRDDNGGANIQVGKYISRGIFVSVNRSVTSETNRVAVEAKVMKNVKVQAEVGDDSEAELILKWKHDY